MLWNKSRNTHTVPSWFFIVVWGKCMYFMRDTKWGYSWQAGCVIVLYNSIHYYLTEQKLLQIQKGSRDISLQSSRGPTTPFMCGRKKISLPPSVQICARIAAMRWENKSILVILRKAKNNLATFIKMLQNWNTGSQLLHSISPFLFPVLSSQWASTFSMSYFILHT